MSSSSTYRTLTLAAFVATVFVAASPAKIQGSARAEGEAIAARGTIGQRRSSLPSPRSSRAYDGPRTLGRRPRVRVSPYAYGSPYGYGRSYGGYGAFGGYGGFRVGGVPVISTTPVASNRIGTARIGLSRSAGQASRTPTVAGRPAPATFRAPNSSVGNDVSFSRVRAARQQFQRRYGFGD